MVRDRGIAKRRCRRLTCAFRACTNAHIVLVCHRVLCLHGGDMLAGLVFAALRQLATTQADPARSIDARPLKAYERLSGPEAARLLSPQFKPLSAAFRFPETRHSLNKRFGRMLGGFLTVRFPETVARKARSRSLGDNRRRVRLSAAGASPVHTPAFAAGFASRRADTRHLRCGLLPIRRAASGCG